MDEVNKIYSYEEAFESSKEYFDGDSLAAKVFVDKYALRDAEMNILEKEPSDMHWREAKEFARIERRKFKKPLTEEQLYVLFSHFKYIVPQGSPMFGIGNIYQFISLSNCYAIESPVDSYAGICKADEELLQISKRRGGVGLDLSKIRPNGFLTRNSSRTSTGINPFQVRYSNSIREVGQGGRRGAEMQTLSIHHPESVILWEDETDGEPFPVEVKGPDGNVEFVTTSECYNPKKVDFITSKYDKTKVTGANISLRITDEFLNAVAEGKLYEQRFPVDAKDPQYTKMVDARRVWQKIIRSAWQTAEPGILFWDNIISNSVADCYREFGFETVTTNPCCFAEDTSVPVLTKNGIKDIKEITSSDLVYINSNGSWAKTSGYFKSGEADVYRVKFSNGRVFEVTGNHKFCIVDEKRQGTVVVRSEGELREVNSLKVGDKISVHTQAPTDLEMPSNGSYDEGLIMGWLSGDRCLSYQNDRAVFPTTICAFWPHEYDAGEVVLAAFKRLGYNLTLVSNSSNGTKRVSSAEFTRDFTDKYQTNIWKFRSEDLEIPFLYNCSLGFIKGYLSSIFSADGTIQCNNESKDYAIQLSSINKKKIQQVCNLLLLFGIKCSYGIGKPAGTSVIRGVTYDTKDCYRLTITGVDNIKRFYNEIGFICEHKQSKLSRIADAFVERTPKCWNFATVKSIEYVGVKPVGCIEVEDYHKFTADGIISGNSEVPLSVLDSCRLLLLNLYSYVVNPFTKESFFDFKLFREHCKIAQRLMDDLVDLEIEKIEQIINKIKSDPESDEVKFRELNLWAKIMEVCKKGRRTGTGITALGDTFAALGVPYASERSIELTDEIYRTMKLACYESSVDMAEEIGPFPIYDSKLEENNPFIMRIRDEAPELYERMVKFGRRNIQLLTTAPAGSVSCETRTTAGIEPLFMMAYSRYKKVNPNDQDVKVDRIDANGDHWQKFEVYHPKVKEWMDVTGETDLSKSPWYGCCAEEINWVDRVRLQAAAQKHVDHSISSTINLPSDVSVEKVAEIYETAWRMKLKGITVYRKGCRDGVLVDSKQASSTEVSASRPCKMAKTRAPKRDKELRAELHHSAIRGVRYYVAVGLMADEPYEVFVGVNHDSEGEIIIPKSVSKGKIVKEGRGKYFFVSESGNKYNLTSAFSDPNADALTRMISTALRHGSDVSFVTSQLDKTRGDLQSVARMIGRTLKKYIKDGQTASGVSCPDCKQESIVYQNGCKTCHNCGWSACS